MREGYEALRQSYEEMRNYHRCDPEHSNVWRINTLSGSDRIHICQKPDGILNYGLGMLTHYAECLPSML